MKPPFVLATGNADKAREICEIFAADLDAPLAAFAFDSAGATVAFVVDAPDAVAATVAALPVLAVPPDVEETGTTLEENARIKAAGVSSALGLPAIADDTGLEVDALGGAPGVWSARYAGPDASYADNVAHLLAALDGVEHRGARFATVALCRWPDGREVSATGTVAGAITPAPRGEHGFGYDPVFVPHEGDGRTFAEMAPPEKHALSHRGRAFRALVAALRRDPPPAPVVKGS